MELLRTKPLQILVIVEGERRELPFVRQLARQFGLNAEFYVFHTNIYTLYQAMKQTDFEGDLKYVLAEMPCMKDQDLQTLRDNKFAYTYLVFDCEAQHTKYEEKSRPLDDVARDNMAKLLEMAEHFTDETEPTAGKLYVNYPMMESYRDCDSVFEAEYQSARVCIDDIKHYKQMTGQKKLAARRLETFSTDDFCSLLRMNIYKLNYMLTGVWGPPTYEEYLKLSEQAGIAAYEENLIRSERCIDVLNTTLFLLTDYFGTRDDLYHYNKIMQLDCVPC